MPLKSAQELSAGKRIWWMTAGVVIFNLGVMAWAVESAPVLYISGFVLGPLCLVIALVGRDPISLLFS